MDFLMESGFMHWMSERMSFTNWVKADFHETSRMTLKFSAPPRLRERYRLGAGSSRYGNCFFSTSSPRSICPSLPLHLSSFSLSCHSFRQPFPFLHLPCPFHVRQERLHVRQKRLHIRHERPKKGVKNFIYIFPHRILIYGIMPVFGQIDRKSCKEKDRVRV